VIVLVSGPKKVKVAHSFFPVFPLLNARLCSFDIENMYTNILLQEVQNIVGNIIDKNYNISRLSEIKNLLNTILEQNYIEHNGKWYKQNDSLAMGALT
jgi:chemotaxis regulatin CheY-phosphate phosphatase CheZ